VEILEKKSKIKSIKMDNITLQLNI